MWDLILCQKRIDRAIQTEPKAALRKGTTGWVSARESETGYLEIQTEFFFQSNTHTKKYSWVSQHQKLKHVSVRAEWIFFWLAKKINSLLKIPPFINFFLGLKKLAYFFKTFSSTSTSENANGKGSVGTWGRDQLFVCFASTARA